MSQEVAILGVSLYVIGFGLGWATPLCIRRNHYV